MERIAEVESFQIHESVTVTGLHLIKDTYK